MTAVEWLENKFNEFETIYYSLPSGLYEYVNQAKEMEKQQIIDANIAGVNQGLYGYKNGKQYYNETFSK